MSFKLELLPPDATLPHLLLYEGYLLTIKHSNVSFTGRTANISPDFLKKTLESLDDELVDSLKVNFTGNDMKPIKSLITSLIGSVPKGKLGALRYVLKALKDEASKITVNRDIRVFPLKTKDGILYDLKDKKSGISLQLLKVDRYTGIGSLESGNFSKQVTTYYSPEAALLVLLGVASAYSTTFRSGDKVYYYLVTFTPGQVAEIISSGKKEIVERYLAVKDEVKEVVAQVMARYPSNELLIMELMLNLKLSESLIKNDIEKADFLLIKLASEGQTYKIYEQIPLTVVKEPPFYRTSDNPEKLRSALWKIINPEESKLVWSVASIGRASQKPEANNALRALLYLYRFVVLGDPQGLLEFTRELSSCYRVCEASNGKGCELYLYYLRLLQ